MVPSRGTATLAQAGSPAHTGSSYQDKKTFAPAAQKLPCGWHEQRAAMAREISRVNFFWKNHSEQGRQRGGEVVDAGDMSRQ